MLLGSERNRLIHQDLGQYSLEMTTREIYQKYAEARLFVESLPRLLRDGGAGS